MSKATELLEKNKGKNVSESLLDKLIDMDKVADLMDDTLEDDKQSSELLYDVIDYFQERFELKRDEEAAFNRLNNLLARKNTDSANARNQVFKIADLLGMKLPSSMF